MNFNFNSMKRTKPIPGGENVSEYRTVMRKIMEGLTRDNFDTLLFLCKEHIPASRDFKNNLEFLKYLEDKDLVSHQSAVFVAEALHIIRRMDLLKLIPCIRNKKHFEDEYLAFTYSSFSSYRVLTVQLQEELSQRDFESFRHECAQHLNNRRIDAAHNVLCLLRNLEEEDVIDGTNFSQLIEILKNIDNVKPLKMFRRLLEGDESVVLPPGKQQQYRLNSEQDMFPDRRSVPIPAADPPAYHSLDRVEAMPYFQRNPGFRASMSTGSDYADHPTKHVHVNEPALFNFDDPSGAIKVGPTNARLFSSDEVTPKALIASSAYPEPLRIEPLPPHYTSHDPHLRSQSVGNFSSLLDNRQHHPSLHPAASYPQMQGVQEQVIYGDNRPVYQQGYYSPPQLQFNPFASPSQSHDSQTSPPQSQDPYTTPRQVHYRHDYPPQSYNPFASYQHHDPQATYHVPSISHDEHPSTSDGVAAAQQQSLQMLKTERDHELDLDSTQLPPLEERIETLAVSDTSQVEGVAVEKVLRDFHSDAGNITESASNSVVEEQEKEESKKQYEEMKAQILRERRDGCYKMDSSPVGLCILINNINFVRHLKVDEYHRRETLNNKTGSRMQLPNIELTDREGSDKDADKLEMLFERLDFDVRRYDDLDHRKMHRVLDEASDADHTNYDCFMLIILSHGGQGCVYGVDGFKVSVPDIQGKFFADRCTTLANKPKIIIIQACQGGKEMPVAYAPMADIESDGPVVDDNLDNGTPNKADFLLAYSTVPGYISYRSRLQGSYYVQEIIRIFKRHHQEEDLLSMMIMVTDAVGNYGKKQVPMPIPTLRKKVYFRLKEGCSLDDLDDSRVKEYPSIQPRGQELVMQESQNQH